MAKDPTKISEGTLERIVEVGTHSHLDWSHIAKGGRGTPRKIFGGTYTVLLLSTKEGEKEQKYEGVVLADSIGHTLEVYTREQTTRTPEKIQLFDKNINRWYR